MIPYIKIIVICFKSWILHCYCEPESRKIASGVVKQGVATPCYMSASTPRNDGAVWIDPASSAG